MDEANLTRAFTVDPGEGGLCAALQEVEGVIRCELRGSHLRVTYNPNVLLYSAILEWLRSYGYVTVTSRWSTLKAGWFDYLDNNARANSQHNPACCSRPPPRR